MSSNKTIKYNKDLVASRINEIRSELGLSIGAMAEHIGISKSTLNSYIRALAMPPEAIVNKISIMSGKSTEWIYYGGERDYIKQLLEFEGYSQFLIDYPETIEQVLKASQVREDYPIKHRYARDLNVKEIFYQIYNPIFVRYIDDLIINYVVEIHKYPIYSGDEDYQRIKYSNRVHAVIRDMNNIVKYGDRDKILQIAETEFKHFVDAFYNKTKMIQNAKKTLSFPLNLCEKLKDKEGAIEVIKYLSHLYSEDFNIQNDAANEVIEAFMELGVKLKRINTKYSKQD